jgi:hypothetical protein
MKLALKNKSAIAEVISKNTALENLINSGYTTNNPSIELNEVDENIFDVSYTLKNAALINNTSTANNHSLISNFIEIPCVNILGNFAEIYQQGLFEKIFMETIEHKNENYIYSEYLKYITKQTKDYFMLFRYNKEISYELIDGKINTVTTIIGINEKFTSIEKIQLTEKETTELLADLKELELDITTPENLALALLELETEKSEIYELLRIYTMYISLSVGIYLDDKQKRNERKSSKRNGTQDIETEPTKLKRVQ